MWWCPVPFPMSPQLLWAQVCSDKPACLLCADPESQRRAQWGTCLGSPGPSALSTSYLEGQHVQTPVRAQGIRPADLAHPRHSTVQGHCPPHLNLLHPCLHRGLDRCSLQHLASTEAPGVCTDR